MGRICRLFYVPSQGAPTVKSFFEVIPGGCFVFVGGEPYSNYIIYVAFVVEEIGMNSVRIMLFS